MARPPFSLRTAAAAVFLVCICVAFPARRPVLTAMGRALVLDEGPAPAGVAVVLGGGFTGHRVLHGAEMVRQGFVKQVLVSGPVVLYGRPESDLAIPFAIQAGYPAEWFVPVPNRARSTEEEARFFYPELHRRGIRSFLLVTSDYHSARAARVFRNVGRSFPPAIAMRVVAAADSAFRGADQWWFHRETQKTVFFELWKNAAYALGL